MFLYSLENLDRESYDSSVVGASDKYFDAEEIDYKEFDQEQKAFVAQLINLIQTLIEKADD